MNPRHLAILMILLLLFSVASGSAAAVTATPPEAAVPGKADDRLPIQKLDEWQFFLSPYAWLAGVNITTSTLRSSQGINVPWWEATSTLFSNAVGLMGRAEAWKGRWGMYLDGYFVYVGGSGSQVGAGKGKNFGPVDFTLNKELNLGGTTINVPLAGQVGPGNIILTPSGSAKFITRIGSLDLGGRFLIGAWPLNADKPLPAFSLELLGGPRFNSINQYIRINLSAIRIGTVPIDLGRFTLAARHESIKNGSYVVDYTNQYFEPFLGLRLGLWLTQKFLLIFKGDVGGFGLVADDHVDCNFEGLFGYRINPHIYAYAGYKARGSWYDLGKNLAQINVAAWVHGPVLGMTYAF